MDQRAAAHDSELVASARGGDGQALEALYLRHKGQLFRTALAVTRERGAAEELLHDAFLRAIRHLDRVSLEPGASLGPWLHRIVINLAYDWVVRRSRSATGLDGLVDKLTTSAASSPERQAECRELEEVVAGAVARLPFKQRIVVILFYLHDMDLVEISGLLNVPEGTVKSRLYYARAKLRISLASDSRLVGAGMGRYVSVQPPVA